MNIASIYIPSQTGAQRELNLPQCFIRVQFHFRYKEKNSI